MVIFNKHIYTYLHPTSNVRLGFLVIFIWVKTMKTVSHFPRERTEVPVCSPKQALSAESPPETADASLEW